MFFPWDYSARCYAYESGHYSELYLAAPPFGIRGLFDVAQQRESVAVSVAVIVAVCR